MTPKSIRFDRLAPLGAVGVALLAWEALSLGLAGQYLLAGPLSIAAYAAENTGLLWRALGATTQTAALGYLWGNGVAVCLAALVLLFPRSERAVRLLSLVVFCLPLIAIGPILRVLYGPGPGPQITLAALSVFYTTLVPLLAGLRAVPRSWLELVSSYGRGRGAQLFHVRAMAAAPYFVAGLQIAAPAAFLGAMIGEFTGAERGMGVLTLRALRSLNLEATWTLATLAAGVSISAYWAAGRLGQWLIREAPAVLLTPPPAPDQRARSHFFTPIALGLGLLLIWYASMEAFGLNRFFAKRPDDIWQFLVASADAAAARRTLFAALAETLAVALPGYLAGLAMGAALAVLCIMAPALARSVLPLAVTLRAVPIVTTAPLIVLALGRGPAGVISIVAVMIFFPTLIACLQGLKQVPGPVAAVFHSYRSGTWATLLHARLPAALPAFFASARMTLPAAVLAATVAEWLATGTGMGNLMALSSSTSNYNMLWSAVVALTVLNIAAHAALEHLERAVFRRYAPEQLAA